MTEKAPMKKQKQEEIRKVPVLLFFPQDGIDRATLNTIKTQIAGSSPSETLYLIVKSSGGDAYSAVRIIRHLRTRFKTIVGVVPDYSYSAATLMLLGCNKLLVAPEGYIGPVDKPLEHTPSGEMISALDMTQAISNLASLLEQQAQSFYEAIRDPEKYEPITKSAALTTSWKSATELICPLIEKIDPILLQKAYRDLRIGMYYGGDLLSTGMLQDDPSKAYDVAGKLVHSYPSHGYAIFREEMRRIGLVVDDLEKSVDAEKLANLYTRMRPGIKYIDDLYA